jgi:hypothetical protein
MFDIRQPIKIFVRNGEVRYGRKVDPGFFPVYSVKEEEDAKVLVEALPWACTDSLTSYARRLESMSDEVLAAKYQEDVERVDYYGVPTPVQSAPGHQGEMKRLQSELNKLHSPEKLLGMHNAIMSAVMGEDK